MQINKELYEKVSELTMTDYEACEFINTDEVVYVDKDSIECMIEDLLSEIDVLREEIEDIEQDRDDNYRPISRAEQYEVSDRDFI